MVNLLRKTYKDVVLTTDIIVGFPDESEKEFEETYKFLEKIKLYKLHVFKYSPRKGTKAANIKNQIDGNEKEKRSKLLLELSNKYELMYNEENVGKEHEILIEEEKDGYYVGHTKNYILAKCEIENTKQEKINELENEIVKVKCISWNKEAIIVRKV